MAATYGFDISRPATNAREAVQWLYFAYLGAMKEQNGAAMYAFHGNLEVGSATTYLEAQVHEKFQENHPPVAVVFEAVTGFTSALIFL